MSSSQNFTERNFTELSCLGIFVNSPEFFEALKKPEFQKFVLGQKNFLESLLLNSFELSKQINSAPAPWASAHQMEFRSEVGLTTKDHLMASAAALPSMASMTSMASVMPSSTTASSRIFSGLGGSSHGVTNPPSRTFQPGYIPTQEELETEIRAIVVRLTGYPDDVVDLHVDLESDLGVDTVKKMEIVAELGEKHQMTLRPNLNFNDISTVHKIAHLVRQDLLTPNPVAGPTANFETNSNSHRNADPVI